MLSLLTEQAAGLDGSFSFTALTLNRYGCHALILIDLGFHELYKLIRDNGFAL